MEHPAGESDNGPLRVQFDRRLRLEFHGSRITADAGLRPYRELADVLGLIARTQKGGADMDRLNGKGILIGGRARGQGAAEAHLLVAQGAKVVIGDALFEHNLDHPTAAQNYAGLIAVK